MRPLPALDLGSERVILPMADRTAAGLLDLVLAESSADQVAEAASLLANDPALALWMAVRCLCHRGPEASALVSEKEAIDAGLLARLLADHAITLLQWPARTDGSPTVRLDEVFSLENPTESLQAAQAEVLGNLVASAAQRAYLATWIAAQQRGDEAIDRPGDNVDPECVLAVVLDDAAAWFGVVAETAPDSAGQLTQRLTDSAGKTAELVAAIDHARQAKESLQVASVDQPADLKWAIAAVTVTADHWRHRWLETHNGPWRWLPRLTARLARCTAIESRFDERLEQEKLDAMAEFAAGAGHEINNPLAVIAGRAQLFLHDERDPERRRELALVNAQAKRVYEMIADMRLFARPPKPEPELIDAAEVVDRALAELRDELARRSIELIRRGEPGPFRMEADPTQLTVALQAMCKNSAEAIGHDGRIEVTLTHRGREVELRVDDTGPGIAPEVRKLLFDPFYSARQAGRGLGLGLSKCWRIVVTNHGGRIDVERSPSGGASFRIRLPKQSSAPR